MAIELPSEYYRRVFLGGDCLGATWKELALFQIMRKFEQSCILLEVAIDNCDTCQGMKIVKHDIPGYMKPCVNQIMTNTQNEKAINDITSDLKNKIAAIINEGFPAWEGRLKSFGYEFIVEIRCVKREE